MIRLIYIIVIELFLLVSNTRAQWSWAYKDKLLWINSVAFATDSKAFAAGTNGIWETTNAGETWHIKADWNTLYYSFGHVVFVDSNTCWLTTFDKKFVKSTDGGNSWVEVSNGTVDGIATETNWLNRNVGYACGGRTSLNSSLGVFWKTTDAGLTWIAKDVPNSTVFFHIRMSSKGNGYLLNPTELWKTNNQGDTWVKTDFQFHADEENFFIHSINDNEAWLFTSSYKTSRKFWMYKTIDAGIHWNLVSEIPNFFLNGNNSACVTNIDNILISGLNELNKQLIYRSIDSGKTWINEYAHPINGQVNLYTLASRGRVTIAAGDYIFRSDNSLIIPSLGDSVVTVGHNFVKQLPKTDLEGDSLVYSLKSAPNFLKITGSLLRGTPSLSDFGNYTIELEATDKKLTAIVSFKLSVTKPVSIEQEEQFTISYTLYQNYPNPFNPTTTINYSISKSGIVSLKVYNVLGREIRTLVSGEKLAGNYLIQFDGSDQASGVLFYELRVNDFVEIKKMQYIR
jgi:photosystem II stability/assembly factor-like uncharacterized protein